jgi:NAD(P)-dependent dehydrogenase (short-subunit alcohol dehydrogenase family)
MGDGLRKVMAAKQSRAIALVTGGALRLGRSISLDLAAQGWQVAVHYNSSADAAEELVRAIEHGGGRAVALQADLTKESDLRSLVPACAERLGTPTLLVNNAARFEFDSIETLDWERWQAELDVNLRAPVFLAQAFAKALPETESGLIVNMLDQKVWRLTPEFFSYTIAKSGLWTATRMLAQALAPRIRVNALGPGPVLPNRRQSEADFERECRSTPLGHGATEAEICAAIRFLIEATSVTGQMIALDGGQHLAWDGKPGIIKT